MRSQMRAGSLPEIPPRAVRPAGRVWAVDVFLDGDDGNVHAEARLHATGKPALSGAGDAGICPGRDLGLGEELAASRALERLAVELLADARVRVDRAVPMPSVGPEGPTRRRPVPRMMVGLDRPLRQTPAVRWALAHAEREGLGIELCHVVDDAGPAWERTLRGSVTEAKEEMAGLLAQVREEHPDLDATSSVLVGSESALLARSMSRELVVVGRADAEDHGAYVGATAMTIAQDAKVPVVVVPTGWSPPQEEPEGPVVVAVDALEPHLEAVELALGYAHWRGRRLLAVAAWQPPVVPGTRMLLDSEEEWMERVADGLDAAVTPLRVLYPDVAVTQRSPHGSPVGVVLGLARDASLLVVGRPGHGRHWRMPLGSVSRRLLHRAEVPVAVVPTGWHTVASGLPRRTTG